MNTNRGKENLNEVSEDQLPYIGFVHKSEDEKLMEDVSRPPIEKLHLFTRMIKREALYNKAKISHT